VSYVEVTNAKETEQVRFAQSPNGQLTIFLPTPAGAQQRIVVRGTLSIAARQPIPFPIMQLLDAETTSLRVDVYRLSDVAKLELDNIEHWLPQDQVPPTAGTKIRFRQRQGPRSVFVSGPR